METKAKIDLKAGIIELEGSEAFVRSYLDEFKTMVSAKKTEEVKIDPPPEKDKKTKATPKVKTPTNSGKQPSKTKSSAKKVQAERFDIHGEGDVPSLEKFMEEKSPGTANDQRVAVIGYYLTELLGNEYFTEGQVEYAYKMLKLARPGNLHQILLNAKNRKDFFESHPDDNYKWALTRGCEIFVSDKLPIENES